jgi:serine/threonine protein kinase
LLADFGLATTDPESEDHGCGSTFYMSPECLDQSSRKPSYRCAPNDIWSLGVILVNLTCGRNPWKQASVEDSTYKAFTKDPNFLKTILPLSDDLNDILGRIFERNPQHRITIGELKQRIIGCASFTAPTQLPTPPQSPHSTAVSDDGSYISDEGSLTGSCSTLSDTDSERDSGYESMAEPEPVCNNKFEVQVPIVAPQVERPAAPVPFTHPQYVLPSQEFHGNPWNMPQKPNPWFQSLAYSSYGQQHGSIHAVPQVHPPIHHHYLGFFQENYGSRGCYY